MSIYFIMRAREKARAFFGGAGRQKFPEAFGRQSFRHLSVSVRHRRPSEHGSCRGTKGAYFLLTALRLACARVCAAMIKFVCGHGAGEMHLCALQVWDGSLLYYKYMRGKSALQGAFALWHKIQDIMHKYSTLKNANIW